MSASIEKKLDKVDEKIEKIFDTQVKHAVLLERLVVTVEDHVKRTNLLQDDLTSIKTNDLEPIKRDRAAFWGVVKLIGLLATLAAIGEGIVAVLAYLKP